MATISIPPPQPVVIPISVPEKQPYSSGAFDAVTGNAVVRTLTDTYNAFQARRETLGLSNPGTVENVAKEVQRDVFLNNLTFSGLRAELTKAFSVSPLFQVCHSFSQGSQQMPPYVFMALYGTPKVRKSRSKEGKLLLISIYRCFARETLTAISLFQRASTTGGHLVSSPRQAHKSLQRQLQAQVVLSSV